MTALANDGPATTRKCIILDHLLMYLGVSGAPPDNAGGGDILDHCHAISRYDHPSHDRCAWRPSPFTYLAPPQLTTDTNEP